MKGEFGNEKVVNNSGSGCGCGVEGSPFSEFLVYTLSDSAPCGFCGFGWGEEDSKYSFRVAT